MTASVAYVLNSRVSSYETSVPFTQTLVSPLRSVPTCTKRRAEEAFETREIPELPRIKRQRPLPGLLDMSTPEDLLDNLTSSANEMLRDTVMKLDQGTNGTLLPDEEVLVDTLNHAKERNHSLTRASPDALSRFPKELALTVMAYLQDDDLLTLTTVSPMFRQLAAVVYFERLNILVFHENYHDIRLHGQIPARAILLLLSTTFTLDAWFSCDLYFLIEHEETLADFCSKSLTITSATIVIPESELGLLTHDRVSSSLRSFLASLSHSGKCDNLSFELGVNSSMKPRRPMLQRKRMRNSVKDREISTLMQSVTSLRLTTALLETETLWRTGRLLLTSPTVFSLSLICHSRVNVNKILSRISFPALTCLYILTPASIPPSIPFLRRHANLNHVWLVGSESACGQMKISKQRGSRKVVLSNLSALRLSGHFCSWMSVMDINPAPQSITVLPSRSVELDECPGSCSTLQELSSCLGTIAARNWSTSALEVLLPAGLGCHLRYSHTNSAVCVTPNSAIPGFKHVTIDCFYGIESCSMEYLLKWTSVFPDLRQLTVHAKNIHGCMGVTDSNFNKFLLTAQKHCSLLNCVQILGVTWSYQNGKWFLSGSP